MASKAQIKARENFVKNYAQKKKGSKSTKPKTKKARGILSEKEIDEEIKHLKSMGYHPSPTAFGRKKMTKSGNKTDIRLRKLKAKKGKK